MASAQPSYYSFYPIRNSVWFQHMTCVPCGGNSWGYVSLWDQLQLSAVIGEWLALCGALSANVSKERDVIELPGVAQTVLPVGAGINN